MDEFDPTAIALAALQIHEDAGVNLGVLFDKLARIEGLHRDQILGRVSWTGAPDPDAFRWEAPEGPGTTHCGDLQYLMTPRHALKLAEHNERRAEEFFAALVVNEAVPQDLRAVATESAGEEREHVRLVQEWLAKFSELEPGWDEDPGPPNAVD